MKNIVFALFLFGTASIAQIQGNGIIETKSIVLEGLTEIEMNLYAKVTVDAGASEEFIKITADSNLLNKIDTEIVQGRMKLSQTEWIRSSQDIEIIIGAPKIQWLQVGVHETVYLNNVNASSLALTALIGKIKASGTAEFVSINAENGEVNAQSLEAENGQINIWGRGKAVVNVKNELKSKLSDEAKISLVTSPKKVDGNTKRATAKTRSKRDSSIKYIDFTIKNNSWNRNNFVVVGPKPDGDSFSYGFPMMPGAKRKERWTTGTKVYKQGALGIRKLLVTISEENEGEVVKLFE